MAILDSLALVVAIGLLLWFGHPVWLGWGWPTVAGRVRETRYEGWGRFWFGLGEVTVEITEPDGTMSIARLPIFSGFEPRVTTGDVLSLRRNPADPMELVELRRGSIILAVALGVLALLGYAALHVE